MVRCSECVSESCLVGTLVPIKHGVKPVVSHGEEDFVKLLKTNGVLFDDQVEDFMYQCWCFCVSSFDVFCFVSPAVG